MPTAVLSIDASPLRALALRLAEVDADRRVALQSIGGAWETSTKGRFDKGVAPDGTPWKPSLRARQKGGQTLMDKRHLYSSIHSQVVDDDTVEVSTNREYAAAHQFGVTIVPKSATGVLRFRLPNGQYVSKKSVTLPARPFIGVNADDYLNWTELLEGFVVDTTGGEP